MWTCACVCVTARKHRRLRVCPAVPDAVLCLSLLPLLSLSLSLQLRWACGASDPLSPTLFLRLSLTPQPQKAMDGLRLPPLIEEALDSTGLCCRWCSCFACMSRLPVCVCVCAIIWDSVLFLAPLSRWNVVYRKCRGKTCLLPTWSLRFSGALASIFITDWLKRGGCCQLWFDGGFAAR